MKVTAEIVLDRWKKLRTLASYETVEVVQHIIDQYPMMLVSLEPQYKIEGAFITEHGEVVICSVYRGNKPNWRPNQYFHNGTWISRDEMLKIIHSSRYQYMYFYDTLDDIFDN